MATATTNTTGKTAHAAATVAPAPTRADEIFAAMQAAQTASETQAMREQAEAQAQAEAAEVVRLAAHETIRRRVQAELDGSDLDAALAQFQQATEHFIAVCKAYDDRHAAILGPINYDSALLPLPDDIKNEGFNMWRPTIGGREIRQARPQNDISKTVREIYQSVYPRHNFSLDNPQD